MEGSLWALATIGGPILLIAVVGYALITRRRLTPREKQDQADSVRDIYRGGDGGENAPPTASSPRPEKDG